MAFRDNELTTDAFLGGRVRLMQPRRGYRAGVDPVLLAASVPAVAGESVLELGCGAGAALLCLAARVPGLQLAGVEIQPDYADLARRNAALNDTAMDIHACSVAALPAELVSRSFDHVIANPPYYRAQEHSQAKDAGRQVALSESLALGAWVDVATRRLRPGGRLSLVLKADRLADALSSLDRRLGSVVVRPLAPRPGRDAELVIIQARKGGRAALRLLAPLVMHRGEFHLADGDDYTDHATDILRHAAALEIK